MTTMLTAAKRKVFAAALIVTSIAPRSSAEEILVSWRIGEITSVSTSEKAFTWNPLGLGETTSYHTYVDISVESGGLSLRASAPLGKKCQLPKPETLLKFWFDGVNVVRILEARPNPNLRWTRKDRLTVREGKKKKKIPVGQMTISFWNEMAATYYQAQRQAERERRWAATYEPTFTPTEK